MDVRERYLGALGLLADCSARLGTGEEAEMLRESIEEALQDAEDDGLIIFRRIVDRFEITPLNGGSR